MCDIYQEAIVLCRVRRVPSALPNVSDQQTAGDYLMSLHADAQRDSELAVCPLVCCVLLRYVMMCHLYDALPCSVVQYSLCCITLSLHCS